MLLSGGRGRLKALIDESGVVVLRLMDVDGGGGIEHQVQIGASDLIRVLWPSVLPAIEALLTVSPEGTLEFLQPDQHIEDVTTSFILANFGDVETALIQISTTMNMMLMALRRANVIQPANIQVTPEPISFALSADYGTIVPPPATMGLSTVDYDNQLTATLRLMAVDPTVT